jgi:hypothetical protein
MRLAFDEADTSTKSAGPAAGTADPERLRRALQRMAEVLSDLIAASSTSTRRDS